MSLFVDTERGRYRRRNPTTPAAAACRTALFSELPGELQRPGPGGILVAIRPLRNSRTAA
jgi:hypothetical protein